MPEIYLALVSWGCCSRILKFGHYIPVSIKWNFLLSNYRSWLQIVKWVDLCNFCSYFMNCCYCRNCLVYSLNSMLSHMPLVLDPAEGLESEYPHFFYLPRIEPSVLSCSPAPPPKNSQNLCNPLWRALASKLLNRLSSVTPFYKWEAMSFHHILSDLVSDFGKGPKRGFNNFFKTYFLNLPNLHSPLWRALASKPLNRLWSVTPFRNGKLWSFTTYFRIWSLIF